jgi:Zn-dependent protease with chaperone function
MTSFWLRLLLWLYFPFLLLLCGLMGWLTYLLVAALINFTCVITVAAPLIVLLLATLLHVLWSLTSLLQRPPELLGIELRLPPESLKPVFLWVLDIARKQKLVLPQDIRMGAETIAHVYEDRKGVRVLVLGGPAVAAFSQETLAGIVAHELAHFTAGDTRLSRNAAGLWQVISVLEYRFRKQKAAHFNPLVWLIRLYHLLFELAWAAKSRQQEFAADGHQVREAGKETAAAALVVAMVSERLPWVRLSSIAKSHVAANEPIEQIFAEHWRRVQSIPADEWQEACKKALKKKTGLFDTHPCLRERLQAIGISPKQAVKLIQHQSGPPARNLFPDWEQIEKFLTEELIMAYRVDYLAKREIAQIILGKPR